MEMGLYKIVIEVKFCFKTQVILMGFTVPLGSVCEKKCKLEFKGQFGVVVMKIKQKKVRRLFI